MSELTNEELIKFQEMMIIEAQQEWDEQEAAEKRMLEEYIRDYEDIRTHELEEEAKELKEKLFELQMLDEMPDDILYDDYQL
jgi:hypothetical protein